MTSTATQSPTAGSSEAAPGADLKRRDEGSAARTIPSCIATRKLPRSPRTTRPGVRPSAR